mmetsp:Transcript_3674/g.10647  ORF Transcript_3674/g.10647 Transcript_3674/m.10647 type:complete len:310 (+) Transcript_3674:3401-4330(+)
MLPDARHLCQKSPESSDAVLSPLLRLCTQRLALDGRCEGLRPNLGRVEGWGVLPGELEKTLVEGALKQFVRQIVYEVCRGLHAGPVVLVGDVNQRLHRLAVTEGAEARLSVGYQREPGDLYRRAAGCAGLQILFDGRQNGGWVLEVATHADAHVLRPIPAVVESLDSGGRHVADDRLQADGQPVGVLAALEHQRPLGLLSPPPAVAPHPPFFEHSSSLLGEVLRGAADVGGKLREDVQRLPHELVIVRGDHYLIHGFVCSGVGIATGSELSTDRLQESDDGMILEILCGIEGQMLQYMCHTPLILRLND